MQRDIHIQSASFAKSIGNLLVLMCLAVFLIGKPVNAISLNSSDFEQLADDQVTLLNATEQADRIIELEQKLAQKDRMLDLMALGLVFLSALILIFWIIKARKLGEHLITQNERDSLTGLFNRKGVIAHAQPLLETCQTAHQSVSLIVLTITKFRRFNAKYGHEVGDWVLQQVTAKIASCGRSGDCFGRIGADEFVVILANCDADHAMQFTARLRAEIENIDATIINQHFKVAASFGITDSGFSGYTLERLFTNASEALFDARHQEKDHICLFEDRNLI